MSHLNSWLFVCLGLIGSVHGFNTCNSSVYNTATSDPSEYDDNPGVPAIVTEYGGVSEKQVLDFSYGYNYWRRGTPGAHWNGRFPDEYNESENSITVTECYGSTCKYGWQGYYIFNGTIFPSDDAEGFFKIWNYYDHSEIWHRLSFRFRQNENNTLRYEDESINYLTQMTLNLAIFDMNKLNRRNYPNEVCCNNSWQDWTFGRSTYYNDSWHDSSAFQLQFSDDDRSRGIRFANRSNENFRRWIEWPGIVDTSNSKEWVDFNVTFQLIDDDTGEATTCDSCYPAIFLYSNGYQFEYVTNLSYSFSNITLERINYYVEDTVITDFYSELVDTPRMDALEDALLNDENIRYDSECPHLWNDLYEWHDNETWSNYNNVIPDTSMENITLPENKTIIVRSCSFVASDNDPYQRIFIPESTTLIFDDADIDLHVKEIYNEGTIYAGNENCRLYSNINFYFYGSKSESSLSFEDFSKPSKGMINVGTVNIHGKLYQPTWTKIAVTAYSGDDRIYLQESVNWRVGQEIVLMTSTWEDFEDDHENERLTIVAIGNSSWTDNNVIYFGNETSNRLNFTHYAGYEYQTEVMLLTRNIKFIGVDSSEDSDSAMFGGHTQMAFSAIGKLSGIEAVNMGQHNVEARYPFHFHLTGVNSESYVQDCSVHDSNFRCFVIHGTHNLTVQRNTAYNIRGHCLYIEDGVEENNTIMYNAIGHVHPIHHIAGGTCNGQYICVGCDDAWHDDIDSSETYIYNSTDLSLPVDTAAGPFYITNMYNRIVGNIASGGWSGFAMINFKKPLGIYLGLDYGNLNPYHRPTLEFDGNTAHSSGFYWGNSGCGACIYAGGELSYNYDYDSYVYFTGKVKHDTTDMNGNDEWNTISNMKTYLCQIGVNYWGYRTKLIDQEVHDSLMGAHFIGENVLQNAIVNAKSNNSNAESILYSSYLAYTLSRKGFKTYPTGVKLYLDNVTFRNFGKKEVIILWRTSSDQHTPEGIMATRNIVYDNCHAKAYRIVDYYCGSLCYDRWGLSEIETQGSRNMAMYDYDGSASETGLPTIITSRQSFWAASGDCMYDDYLYLWYCPFWSEYYNDTWNFNFGYNMLAHFAIDVPGLTDGARGDLSIDTEDTDEDAIELTVSVAGYLSLWGDQNYTETVGIFPGVAGMSNTGWYFRTIYGAPKFLYFNKHFQIPPKSFVLFAMRYPANTEINVTLKQTFGSTQYPCPYANSFEELAYSEEDLYPNYDDWVCELDYSLDNSWFSLCNVTGGYGPAWYWDNEFLYIRVVAPIFYTYASKASEMLYSNFWDYDGLRLYDISSHMVYQINATCYDDNGDECDQTFDGYFDIEKADIPPDRLSYQNFNWTGYYGGLEPDTPELDTSYKLVVTCSISGVNVSDTDALQEIKDYIIDFYADLLNIPESDVIVYFTYNGEKISVRRRALLDIEEMESNMRILLSSFSDIDVEIDINTTYYPDEVIEYVDDNFESLIEGIIEIVPNISISTATFEYPDYIDDIIAGTSTAPSFMPTSTTTSSATTATAIAIDIEDTTTTGNETGDETSGSSSTNENTSNDDGDTSVTVSSDSDDTYDVNDASTSNEHANAGVIVVIILCSLVGVILAGVGFYYIWITKYSVSKNDDEGAGNRSSGNIMGEKFYQFKKNLTNGNGKNKASGLRPTSAVPVPAQSPGMSATTSRRTSIDMNGETGDETGGHGIRIDSMDNIDIVDGDKPHQTGLAMQNQQQASIQIDD